MLYTSNGMLSLPTDRVGPDSSFSRNDTSTHDLQTGSNLNYSVNCSQIVRSATISLVAVSALLLTFRTASMRNAYLAYLIALFLLTVTSGVSAQRIDLDDLDSLVGVSSPRISPDGESVVIVTSKADLDENIDRRQLVLVDVKTGSTKPLTFARDGVAQPRWSPDGEHLAFIASNGEKEPSRQVMVLSIRGGEAKTVTHAPQGVLAFEWSADGDAIFYLAAGAKTEPPEGPERHNRSFVVGFHDYMATQTPPAIHLWHQTVAGGEARRINGDDVVAVAGQFQWMHVAGDGRAVAFFGFPADRSGDFRDSALIVIDPETGDRRDDFGSLRTSGWGAFSPDGSRLAYRSSPGGNPFFSSPAIAVAEASGDADRIVSSTIDRGLWGAHWMPDGQSLIVGGNDGARTSLWLQPLSGPARRVNMGDLNAVTAFGPPDLDVSAEGAIALVASGPRQPPELFWIDEVGRAPKQLTNFNKPIASLTHGASAEIRWETDDGFEANGILIYPPDFDPNKRYPLVLKIHGGPMAATTLRWDGFGQVLAARGFLVFGPNYRGSDNLGNAFQAAIINDAGEGPGKDVMAGLAEIQAQGIVDETRIGVSGWSYGGYMTTWLIGNYPDVWRAAMAGAPVTDYLHQYTLSDMNMTFGWGFDAPPWGPEGQENWRRQAPMTYVHQATAPTLIMCNTGDLRTPITQSYTLFHALEHSDVPVQFIAYPIPGHFPGDPVHRHDVLRRWADWMEQRFEVPRDAPVGEP